MWNPLRLPLAVFGVAVDAARALAELPRTLAALEARLDRLDRLGEQAAAVLSELERVRAVVEGLTEQVALVLAEVQALRDQLAGSAAVQDQLEHTREELAEANRQLGRMLQTDGE